MYLRIPLPTGEGAAKRQVRGTNKQNYFNRCGTPHPARWRVPPFSSNSLTASVTAHNPSAGLDSVVLRTTFNWTDQTASGSSWYSFGQCIILPQ